MEQELRVLNNPYTLHKHAHTKDSVRHCGGVVTQSAEPTRCTMSTTMLKRDLGTGDLCNNIGLVGVSLCHCHCDQAIPILSPLLFIHVGHPYIPLFKIQRIFDLLVIYYCMLTYNTFVLFL